MTVLTRTPAAADRPTDYKIIRGLDARNINRAVAAADVVHCNGPSLRITWHAILAGKPVVWTHPNYRFSCVDGLGWLNGRAAPLSPWASARLHLRARGFVALPGIASLIALRIISPFVAAHVAVSHHMERRLSLPGARVIYNPVELFEERPAPGQTKFDFGFVGRLVSEKGCDVLLKALAACVEQAKTSMSLIVIGDGPERARLEQLADKLGLSTMVEFAGSLTGVALRDAVAKADIFVLPSVYEEPMGVVALELLSAGKALIVSETGGLAECAGDAALTSPNGDASALAAQMQELRSNAYLRARLMKTAPARLQNFMLERAVDQYLQLFAQVQGHQPYDGR